MRIAVDTGGTFTDCVTLAGKRPRILKVFSAPPASPAASARAILDGARQLSGPRSGPSEIIHGTTAGTNSLLERRGARVGLITTAGFEDLIEIGRQARPRLYDLNVERDSPLVEPGLRLGVGERTSAGGRILVRPERREIERLKRHLARSKVESLALSFLFSFANPADERTVMRALRALKLPLSVSHEILPEFREYERTSTVVINAFLAPQVGAYLKRLERDAAQAGRPSGHRAGRSVGSSWRPARVFIMQSSGGITTAALAAREPVRTILSGPAGGVAAASWLQKSLSIPRALSLDMGGTSTDVCLLDGDPRTTNETRLGGLPIAVPVLDVHSVGAGGGSLARIDPGGALRVGPQSAGASPGPACYGRGGAGPTVTDANLILGRIDPGHFLGGTFLLDAEAARQSFHRFLRGPSRRSRTFGSPVDLARGIVAVANANMEKALRVISVERGHDPRDFVLISFGGAGGLHAAALARSLGMARVIVPSDPGAFSALGILLSDVVKDVSRSVLLPVPEGPDFAPFLVRLERAFRELERAARREFRRERPTRRPIQLERSLDVRYRGQSYELPIPLTPAFPVEFHGAHRKAYGYAHAGSQLEVVNLRLRLRLPTPKYSLPRLKLRSSSSFHRALVKERDVWFAGRFHRTPLYARELLPAGARIPGPAVIVEYSATTAVPPDFECGVDEYLNLELRQHAR